MCSLSQPELPLLQPSLLRGQLPAELLPLPHRVLQAAPELLKLAWRYVQEAVHISHPHPHTSHLTPLTPHISQHLSHHHLTPHIHHTISCIPGTEPGRVSSFLPPAPGMRKTCYPLLPNTPSSPETVTNCLGGGGGVRKVAPGIVCHTPVATN